MAQESINIQGFKAEITIRTASLSVGLAKYYISSQNFIHYIRDEQYAMVGKPRIGLSLPTGELKVALDTPQSALKLLRADAVKVDIKTESTFGKELTLTYDVTNYDFEIKGAGVIATLYMIADLGDLINKTAQQAYGDESNPVSSIKAVYDAVSNIRIDLDADTNATQKVDEFFATEDKQVWIQANSTYLEFIANTIKHCNVKDDLILCAINQKKLKLISYNEAMKKTQDKVEAYIYLATPKGQGSINKDAVQLLASSVNLESAMGVYSYLTGVKEIPQIKILENKQNIFDKILSYLPSAKKNDPSEDSNPLATERIVAPLIDCGNTHENYWGAQFANERKLAKIYRNIVYITVDGVVIDDSLNILDTAHVDLRGLSQNDKESLPFLDGNFIVLGISRYVSHSIVSNRIALGRESYS